MAKVGQDGRMVIEKEVREQLGVQPGWTAVQKVVDGHLEVFFEPPQNGESSLFGVFHEYTKNVAGMTWEEVQEAESRAWEDSVLERYGHLKEETA